MKNSAYKTTDSNSVYNTSEPYQIINNFPTGDNVQFGRIPTAALTAINVKLNERARKLLTYYACQRTRFSPSALEINKNTGISERNFYKARQELVDTGYITLQKNHRTGQKELIINWPRIIQESNMLRASAEIAAEDPNCNGRLYPREKNRRIQFTRKSAGEAAGNAYNSPTKTSPTIHEIFAQDHLAAMSRGQESLPAFDGYYENSFDCIENLTEDELDEVLSITSNSKMDTSIQSEDLPF